MDIISENIENSACKDVDLSESLNQSEADLIVEEIQYCRNLLPINIDLSSLDYVLLADRDKLPNTQGIYFVLEDEKVIYIGLSKTSILRRWWTHEKVKDLIERKGEIKIAWFECRAVDLLPLMESTLIGYFDPPLNQTVGEGIPRYFKHKRQQLEENGLELMGKRIELRKTDWLLVEEVAAKLKLSVDEALMWIIRLGASHTVNRYRRMINNFERKLKK